MIDDQIARAVKDGHVKFEAGGRKEKILYVAANRRELWSDPEEKVRASFFCELVYRYNYAPNRIGVEVTVPDRSPNDFADLVVFRDDRKTRPYAVIECKREAISDAQFRQAVEQAWGNGNAAKFRAQYVGVVAGETRLFFDCDDDKFGALERDTNVIADLPLSYGRPPEYKYRKGTSQEWQDLKPVSKGDLIAIIRKCHQTLWAGGKLSPPAAFGEFCKIIFVKVRDEKRARSYGEHYGFQIKTDEPAHILAGRIRALYAVEMQREPDVFTEDIRVDDATLKMCVSHLEAVNFNKTDLDTKGVAFEQFLDGFFKGDFGQFFTPREVIQFAVALSNPEATDDVLDPACGSGGFLLYAMDHVRARAKQIFQPHEVTERHDYWHDFARNHLFGIEVNDEIARVAKMNMILHDDGHTNIVGEDALSPLKQLSEHRKRLKQAAFDLILTNPPFGSIIKEENKGQLYFQGWTILHQLSKKLRPDDGDSPSTRQDSGKKAIKGRSSVKSEILFCERVSQFLKPGTGKSVIVLPDGLLTNSTLVGFRRWLIEHFQLLAVISLPNEAFQHSKAQVKASVLYLRRRAEKEVPNKAELVFMALPSNIGYDSRGRRTYEVIQTTRRDDDRVEIHSHHLFQTEVRFESKADGSGVEKERRILNGSGILGRYQEFSSSPSAFRENQVLEMNTIKGKFENAEHLSDEADDFMARALAIKIAFDVHDDGVSFIATLDELEQEGRLDPLRFSGRTKLLRQAIRASKYPTKALRCLVDKPVSGDWGTENSAFDPENPSVKCLILRATEFDTVKNLSLASESLQARWLSTSSFKRRGLKQGDILLEKSGGGPKQPVGRLGLWKPST